MSVYYRTGRRTGVGLGCVGLTLIGFPLMVLLGGIIYESNGAVWGCDGGGNWCANAGPLPGGCPR